MFKYTVDAANAEKIMDWLNTRGGILIWKSVQIGNQREWATPATSIDGNERTARPHWSAATTPDRHITNVAEVAVTTAKEVKRFHVATRMGRQGLLIKVTDGGTRRIKKEVEKAEQKYGKQAWYEFDYCDYNNAVIMVEDATVPLEQYMEQLKSERS